MEYFIFLIPLTAAIAVGWSQWRFHKAALRVEMSARDLEHALMKQLAKEP